MLLNSLIRLFQFSTPVFLDVQQREILGEFFDLLLDFTPLLPVGELDLGEMYANCALKRIKGCSCWTYLESREVLLHVAPAKKPHLVVGFVVVELDRIGVCADGLQR